MNIFVGNLSFQAQEADVHRAFAAFGTLASVSIVMEKGGKKSRGFGFVDMPDESEALAAISGLHGTELLGRPINVMPALAKKAKSTPAGKKNKGYARGREYRGGRRTRSFMARRAKAGITGPVLARTFKVNPLRWRKKRTQLKTRKKQAGPARISDGHEKKKQKS
jgi:RNA recognition motif-containing protein